MGAFQSFLFPNPTITFACCPVARVYALYTRYMFVYFNLLMYVHYSHVMISCSALYMHVFKFTYSHIHIPTLCLTIYVHYVYMYLFYIHYCCVPFYIFLCCPMLVVCRRTVCMYVLSPILYGGAGQISPFLPFLLLLLHDIIIYLFYLLFPYVCI